MQGADHPKLIQYHSFNSDFTKLDSTFIGEIFKYNIDTLKNIWFSESSEFSDVPVLLQAIKKSKLETIIWDQIRNITQTLVVPETLKTLILENCVFTNKVALDGLNKAYNL